MGMGCVVMALDAWVAAHLLHRSYAGAWDRSGGIRWIKGYCEAGSLTLSTQTHPPRPLTMPCVAQCTQHDACFTFYYYVSNILRHCTLGVR